MTVADALLGSRFWYSASTEDLSRLLKAKNDSDDLLAKNAQGVVPSCGTEVDTNLASFFLNGSSDSVKQALNRAEAFSLQHLLGDDTGVAERNAAKRTAQALDVDIAKVVGNVVKTLNAPGGDDRALYKKAEVAVVKLLASDDFKARAEQARTSDVRLGEDPFSAEGRNALLNAALGLTAMLRDGKISEEAVLAVANGQFYDLTQSSDVLSLALTAAQQVKTEFVDEVAIREVVEKCQNGSNNIVGGDDLKELANRIIEKRKAIVANIPTQQEPVDRKSVLSQIKSVREALRAFRYDLDKAMGTEMKASEKLRRWADNLSFSSREKLVTAESLHELERLEQQFAEKVEELSLSVPKDKLPVILSTQALAQKATDLSHRTNDAIRYHYSKAWKTEESFAKDVHGALDDITLNGGSRSVSFSVGADVMAAFNLAVVKGQAKIGGRYQLTANVSVPAGGGQVTVTYRNGGTGVIGASGKVGVGSVAANVSADFSAGGGKSVTRVYPNLNEFVKDMNATNSVVLNRSVFGLILGGVSSAVRKIGHGFLSAATAMGLRIHRSKFDNATYTQRLRERNTFKNVDMMMSTQRNAVVTQRREAVDRVISGGASASGKVTDKVSLGGSFSVSDMRETRATSTVYSPLLNSLAYYGHAELVKRFNGEGEVFTVERQPADEETRTRTVANFNEVRALLKNCPYSATGVAEAIRALALKHDQMEALMGERISVLNASRQTRQEIPETFERYAKLQRLYVFAAMILKARAAAFKDSSLTRAAEGLCSLVSVPGHKLPQEVFERFLLDGTRDRVTLDHKKTFSFSFDVNAFDGVDHKLFGENHSLLPDEVRNALLDSSLEKAGSLTGTHSKLVVDVTKGATESEENEVRPWMKGTTSTRLSFALSGSMPARAIFLAIATAVAKSNGSDDEKARFLSQAWRTLKESAGSLKKNAIKAVAGAGAKILSGTVGELVGGGGEKDPQSLTGVVPQASFVEMKRFTLDFSADGRLTSLTVSDEETDSLQVKASGGQVIGGGIEVGVSVSTKAVDAVSYKKPSFATILGRVSDFVSGGQTEPLKNFLASNAKGVLRLVDIMLQDNQYVLNEGSEFGLRRLRQALEEQATQTKDKYLVADFEAFGKMRLEIRKLLADVVQDSRRTAAERLEATRLAERFEDALSLLNAGAARSNKAFKIEVAREIFTAMSLAYMFAARPPAQPSVEGYGLDTQVPVEWNEPPKEPVVPPKVEPSKVEQPQVEPSKVLKNPMEGILDVKATVGNQIVLAQTPRGCTCFGVSLLNALVATEDGRRHLETMRPGLDEQIKSLTANPPSTESMESVEIYKTLTPLEKLIVHTAYGQHDYKTDFDLVAKDNALPMGNHEGLYGLFGLKAYKPDGDNSTIYSLDLPQGYKQEAVKSAVETALSTGKLVFAHGGGHFVALTGYDSAKGTVSVVDSRQGYPVVETKTVDSLLQHYNFSFAEIA